MTAVKQSPIVRRPRLRFSVAALLVFVIVVSITASIGVSNYQSRQLRLIQAENRRLKAEVGELTVELGEQHKLHAIAIGPIEPHVWKWRLHIPQGRAFQLSCAAGDVQPEGPFAASFSTTSLSPGEYMLTLALGKDSDNNWLWITQYDGASVRLSVSRETAKLLDTVAHPLVTSTGVPPKQVSVDPGTNLELIRLRMFPQPAAASSTSPDVNGPAPGALLWIHENAASDANHLVPNPGL